MILRIPNGRRWLDADRQLSGAELIGVRGWYISPQEDTTDRKKA